jgi:hypothetical protein
VLNTSRKTQRAADREAAAAEMLAIWDADLVDALRKLGNPPVVTLSRLRVEAAGFLPNQLSNRRAILRQLDRCGYVPIRNPGAKDGLWNIGGVRQVGYTRKDLSYCDQLAAARRL